MVEKREKIFLYLILLFIIIIKIGGLVKYKEYYFDTRRMIYLFEIADNIVDNKGVMVSETFIERAMLENKREGKNIDFYKLKNKIKKDKYRKPVLSDTWGYVVLLVVFWKIFGIHSFIPIQIFQILLDILAIIALYKIGIFIFEDKRKAIAGIVLYTTFPVFLMMSVVAARDFYAAWGMIFSLFFYVRFLQTGEERNILYSGLIIAIFLWFRATIILFPFILLFHYIFWQSKKTMYKWIKIIALVWVPIISLFIIPFSLQYKHYMGTYNFLVIKNLGTWESLGEFPNKYIFEWSDEAAYKRAQELGYRGDIFTAEMARYLQKDVKTVFNKDKLFVLSCMLKRFKKYFSLLVTAKWLDNKLLKVFYSFVNFIIFAFLWFFIDIHNWKKNILLLSVFIYKFGVHIFSHMEMRYLMEGYWSMAILSGGFIIYLWDYIKEKLDKRRNKNVRKNTI